MGFVITLSGAIGSRRSEIAEKLAVKFNWPRVKFSEYIKDCIKADDEDPEDRVLQQQYGQRLVQNDLEDFVDGVLAKRAGWEKNGGNLIVDGLRHVEVLLVLRRRVTAASSKLVYIHVRPDPLKREPAARERGIAGQDIYRYDRALSEAQMNRILPAYADLEVDGALGIGLNLKDIEQRLSDLGASATA
jgi:hypothetical protein